MSSLFVLFCCFGFEFFQLLGLFLDFFLTNSSEFLKFFALILFLFGFCGLLLQGGQCFVVNHCGSRRSSCLRRRRRWACRERNRRIGGGFRGRFIISTLVITGLGEWNGSIDCFCFL
mmetsp:Transcript_18378/g.52307  ORF Transcript_18378/g.52307 Transcript_18378/m.52307 type:complete len:117 (-) Transcript_18378:9-359(-)